LEAGKNFFWKNDREGNLICYVVSRRHERSKQTHIQSSDHTVYSIELGRRLRTHDDQLVTVVFDLANSGMASLDPSAMRFMINCFQAYYPENLSLCLIKDAPWVFWGFWKLVKPLLDPVVASKIRFVNTADLQKYVDPENLPQSYGGTDPFVYRYVYPPYSVISSMRTPTMVSPTDETLPVTKVVDSNSGSKPDQSTSESKPDQSTSKSKPDQSTSEATSGTLNSSAEFGLSTVSANGGSSPRPEDLTRTHIRTGSNWVSSVFSRSKSNTRRVCDPEEAFGSRGEINCSSPSTFAESSSDIQTDTQRLAPPPPDDSIIADVVLQLKPLERSFLSLTRRMGALLAAPQTADTQIMIEDVRRRRNIVKFKICELYRRRDSVLLAECFYDRVGVLRRQTLEDGGHRIAVDWGRYDPPGSLPPLETQSETAWGDVSLDENGNDRRQDDHSPPSETQTVP